MPVLDTDQPAETMRIALEDSGLFPRIVRKSLQIAGLVGTHGNRTRGRFQSPREGAVTCPSVRECRLRTASELDDPHLPERDW